MVERYRVRNAGVSDVAAIAALERRIFSDPWSAGSIRSLLGDFAMVATTGEVLVGYVLARRVLGEGEILNVAVDPARRRQGIGRMLLGAMLDRLDGAGVDTVFLEVRASNGEAQSLYAGFGFSEVAVRPGYYERPPEDAVIMARRTPRSERVREKAPKRVSSVDKRT